MRAYDWTRTPSSEPERWPRSLKTTVRIMLTSRQPKGWGPELTYLYNQAPLGVYLVDDQFRIAAVNPAALPVFGAIPHLVGRDFPDVIRMLWPEACASDIVNRFRHTLETGEPYSVPEHIEQRVYRKAANLP